jgi:predicted phosphodiesterase
LDLIYALVVIILVILLVVVVFRFVGAEAEGVITPQDNGAKRDINNFMMGITQGEFNNVSSVTIKLFNDSNSYTFTRQYQPESPTTPPLPVPTEICGNGIDDDGDGLIDEGCPVIPPTTGSIPAANTSKFFRMASIADIDDNSGLDTQAKIAKKYGAQIIAVHGDLDYNSISNVFNRLAQQGYTADKLFVSDGNHDNCSDIQQYLGVNSCVYSKTYSNGKVLIQGMKGSESSMPCNDGQYNDVKTAISTNRQYEVISIHQPFVTVKSDHPPNGGFNCYNPLFKSSGVDAVLQGHNHNYQSAIIDNIIYGLHGTGTHDTGSAMYDCDSSTFGNFNVKCITGTNGITIIDFQIDGQTKINGYFVSNADKLVHTFTSGGN